MDSMDTTVKLREVPDYDIIRREFEMPMKSRQIKPVLELFGKHINKKGIEISELQQKNTYRFFLIFENFVKRREKRLPSSLLSNSETSHFSSAPRKYDLNLIKNIEGPLIDGIKWEYIESVKNLLMELLSAKVMSKYDRREWTVRYCSQVLLIPKDLVLNWITSTRHIDSN